MEEKRAHQLMKMATIASVGVAIIIVVIKLIAWWFTDALSLMSSLVDSVLDIGASLLGFFAVRYAILPADEDHRFGHGKAEDIAAFAQGAFVAGSGLFILSEAVGRMIHPEPIQHEWVGVWTMVASTCITFVLLAFQAYVIRQTDSSVIKADSLHYKADILVNILVITVLLLHAFTDVVVLDAIFAALIACYIFYSAWSLGKDAFDKLMDKEFSDKERKRILDVIVSHKEVLGVHDLRTRRSGITSFIQFHLELSGRMSLSKAHKIGDVISSELIQIFPDAQILIHHDPYGEADVDVTLGRVVAAEKR